MHPGYLLPLLIMASLAQASGTTYDATSSKLAVINKEHQDSLASMERFDTERESMIKAKLSVDRKANDQQAIQADLDALKAETMSKIDRHRKLDSLFHERRKSVFENKNASSN